MNENVRHFHLYHSLSIKKAPGEDLRGRIMHGTTSVYQYPGTDLKSLNAAYVRPYFSSGGKLGNVFTQAHGISSHQTETLLARSQALLFSVKAFNYYRYDNTHFTVCQRYYYEFFAFLLFFVLCFATFPR